MTEKESYRLNIAKRKYEQECRQLLKHGFEKQNYFMASSHPPILGKWRGTINVDLGKDKSCLKITFDIIYPRGYPWSKPHIIPVEPSYRRYQHQQTSWDKWANRLCIWEDNSDGWRSWFTLEDVLSFVHDWFKKAELGWEISSEEEACVFDLERYFGDYKQRDLVLFPNGFSAVNKSMGYIELLSLEKFAIVKRIDGEQCNAFYNCVKAVGEQGEGTIQKRAYIQFQRQPSFPFFLDLGQFVEETAVQGLEKRDIYQHLVRFISQRDNRGEFVLIYPAMGKKIGCCFGFVLNKGRNNVVPGFRPNRAPIGLILKKSRESVLDSAKARCIDSETLLQRNPKNIQGESLRKSSVTILGLGSVGSVIAECLTKAGVDHLYLVDGEVLEAGNVIRHTCGLEGVGKKKTEATKSRLNSIRPDMSVECIYCSVEENVDEVIKSLENSQLIIDCTANEIVQNIVAPECYLKNVDYIRVMTYYSGKVGEIVHVGQYGVCIKCIEKELFESRKEIMIPSISEQETVITEGCAAVTVPATAADLLATCALSAQACIKLLLKEELGWNYRVWVGKPLEGVEDDSIYRRGPQVNDFFVEPSERCMICKG